VAQRRYYLPRIPRRDDYVSGLLEPNAGSDLADSSARALEATSTIVNGTSSDQHAQYANSIFCLCHRNEGRPKAGISFLLIDCARGASP